MTIAFIDGFDRYPNTGGGVGVRGKWVYSTAGALVTGRVGGQGYELGSNLTDTNIRRPVPASTQYSIFFAMKHNNYTGSVVTNNFALINSTGIEVVGFGYNFEDTLIVRIRGVDVVSLPLTFGPGVWFGVSVVYENHASLGKLQIRINGELVVDISNVNTTFQSGTNQVTDIKLAGKPTSGVGGLTQVDDVRVDYDTLTPIPEGRMAPKFPTGDVVADWSRLSGANNYAMIDEITCDSDTTYNYSTVKNTKDEYSFGALGFTPDKILAVQVAYAARKDDASTRVIGAKLKWGAFAPAMAPNYLGTDYAWHEKNFVAADFSESEITLAMLNAMTVEIEDLGDGT